MELLLFRAGDGQIFGIDVARVREVVRCPELRQIPGSAPAIRGVMTLRGNTFAVTDMSVAIGRPALRSAGEGFVIVTTCSDELRGLLVSHVERIIKISRQDLKDPPRGITPTSCLAAVISYQDVFVEIIDMDSILAAAVECASADALLADTAPG